MPPDHRTFIRQRVILMSENTDDKKQNLRYLAHIRYEYLGYRNFGLSRNLSP
jgi:hypothetical protein